VEECLIEVGEKEKHIITYSCDPLSGRQQIEVDGVIIENKFSLSSVKNNEDAATGE